MSTTYDIDNLLDEVVTLPSMPTTLATITDLVNDPDPSLVDIGKAISADPAIALKTLRLVNSAYCGLRQRINSVEHAVAMLGLKVIKNLVFTATVFEALQSDMENLTGHSIACGFAMRALAEGDQRFVAAKISAEEVFVFGLLHDVGKILFEQFLPKETVSVAASAREKGIPWFKAERDIIGVDHAQLGSRLAEKWNLPSALVGSIAGHHDLTQCSHASFREPASMLCLADYLCNVTGFHAVANVVTDVPDEMWRTAGVDRGNFDAVTERFRESEAAIKELAAVAK